MTVMENAIRELMGIIADNQLAVAPLYEDASPSYWKQRGKWEGLEIAYGIVKEWMDDNAKLLKEQETVEPKTGHWIYKRHDDVFMCSSCEKHSVRNDYPYCHWCGAKMDDEVEGR